MAVSASGLCTLLALVLIGPLIYLGLWFKNRGAPTQDEKDDETAKTDVTSDERETMSSAAYTFALIGWAIGIGNVWRFPYVIASNGGAAAVFAYALCAIFVAIPLNLYEMILGQYTRLSSSLTWHHIHPRWLSFGLAQGLMSFIANMYFCVIISYTFPYIIGATQDPFPWEEVGPLDYWNNDILNRYPDLNDKPAGLGPLQGHLVASLLVLWIIIFFSVTFGKEVLSKITYVTVIMPLVLLCIFVARTVFLEGAGDGIRFYIGKFEWHQLKDLDVWATALSQILFSLSPGFGTAITYSSYAHRKEDVFKTAMIVSLANSSFSLVSGFGVFAMVGNLAYTSGQPVEEVASRGGAGLAFITIASAMETFGSAKNIMAVLFFFMLFTLGLDSSYAWTETVVSIIQDIMDLAKKPKRPLWQVTLGVSLASFLLGLVFVTRMGNETMDVVDHFVGIQFLLIVCGIEAIILNFEFGWQRLALALKAATYGLPECPEGRRIFPTYLCRFDFHCTVPFMCLGLALYVFINDLTDPYGGYPKGLLRVGWTMLGICVVSIFATFYKKGPGSLPPLDEDPKLKMIAPIDLTNLKEDSDEEEGMEKE